MSHSNSSNGPKRSFSTVLSRRQSLNSVGGTAITVSSSQFVFLEDNSRTVNSSHAGVSQTFTYSHHHLDEHSPRDDVSSSALDGSRSNHSRNQRKRQVLPEDSASTGSLKRSKTLPTPQSLSGGSSLFDKLVERAGPVMTSHSCKPASNPSTGKKLLLSGRIRSN